MGSFIENERKSIKKLESLRLLPYRYKKLFIGLFLIILVITIASKFIVPEMDTFRLLLKNMLLITLLLISITRGKDEDERTIMLRNQSYSFAFIAGIVYALVQPFIDMGMNILVKAEDTSFSQVSVSQVLLSMLLIQIFYFSFIKRLT